MRLIPLDETRRKLGGRSRASVYRDLEANRIPQPIKLGGRLYWNEEALDAFIVSLSIAKEGRNG